MPNEDFWIRQAPYGECNAEMFGGYTEVAAFYVNTPWPETEEDGGEIVNPGLPSDYTPHYIPADPWHQQAACQKDFILIAEFSEQEGPKPLIVIPKEGGGDFDLNEFSVRIMSVDFQTVAGSSFTPTEDTQLIMSEAKNGVHAYVHHFTLYDYKARGFVRPFCMSYVTPDQTKLWTVFDKMSARLKEVAQCFKHGNLSLFVKDMTHYLSDLHYTKGKFLEREEILNSLAEDDRSSREHILDDPEEDNLLRTVNLSGLNNLIKEVKTILEATSNMLTEVGAREYDPESKVPDDNSPQDDRVTVPVDNFHYSCSLHNTTSELFSYVEGTRPRAGSVPLSKCNWTDVKDIYTPKVVRTTNKKHFEKSLRSLHELCMWGAKEGLNQLRILYKYFSRELYAIETEQADVSYTIPQWGLLTVGETVQLNFLSDLDIIKTSMVNNEAAEGNIEKKSSDSDTVMSFYSADSYLSCEEDDLTLTNHYCPAERSDNMLLPADEMSKHRKMTDCDSVSSASSSVIGFDIEKWTVDNAASVTSEENSRLFLPLVSPDTCISLNVVSLADHVSNISQCSPGFGIHKLMAQSPSLCHVVYSLLCGRPTVVFGTVRIEKEICATVNALSLFIPGYSNSAAVKSWHLEPLTIRDISYHRLIGLARPERRKLENMVPSAVKGYITILDLEKKMIWAPEYQGGLLTDIYNKSKVLDERAYISYIHSVLFEFSLKAYLYFHNFCLGNQFAASSQRRATDNTQITSAAKQYHRKTKSAVLDGLKVTKYDSNIVEHFSDVVASQHLEVCMQYNSNKCDSAVASVQLGYTKCSWFKV